MRIASRTAGLATGAVLTSALLSAATTPATAYDPDPSYTVSYRDTDNCPCTLTDPIDNTYFKWDPNGYATKVELRGTSTNPGSAPPYLGKVEFHPYDEKLWIYDTRNDGDTFYVRITYRTSVDKAVTLGSYSAGGTSATVDTKVYDLDIPEGEHLNIWVYDDANGNDQIITAIGTP
ncbi:hypothetical protein [Streptomyces sp. M92]|uniref:hypothetical protein n=1 Tax=Streptomyces sp. M92 TaxID=2944250 RepID=UPI00234AC36B|nr:hypothetical protein [Streptomyces sp. M92]WCN05081.1 hypothetical protein M6G08_24840 [Streptomyces sp. M92]